jgi:hypothetical protein
MRSSTSWRPSPALASLLALSVSACGDTPLTPDEAGASQESTMAMFAEIIDKLETIEARIDSLEEVVGSSGGGELVLTGLPAAQLDSVLALASFLAGTPPRDRSSCARRAVSLASSEPRGLGRPKARGQVTSVPGPGRAPMPAARSRPRPRSPAASRWKGRWVEASAIRCSPEIQPSVQRRVPCGRRSSISSGPRCPPSRASSAWTRPCWRSPSTASARR